MLVTYYIELFDLAAECSTVSVVPEVLLSLWAYYLTKPGTHLIKKICHYGDTVGLKLMYFCDLWYNLIILGQANS